MRTLSFQSNRPNLGFVSNSPRFAALGFEKKLPEESPVIGPEQLKSVAIQRGSRLDFVAMWGGTGTITGLLTVAYNYLSPFLNSGAGENLGSLSATGIALGSYLLMDRLVKNKNEFVEMIIDEAYATGKKVAREHPFAEVTDESFERDVLNSELPVLVHFYSPSCSSCLNSRQPWLLQLDGVTNEQVKILSFDVDENKMTPIEYGTAEEHKILFFVDGKVMTDEALMEWVSDKAVSNDWRPGAFMDEKLETANKFQVVISEGKSAND